MESAERDAGAEAQAARKTVARSVRREFRLVCLLDRTAEALFKLSDGLGDSRLSDAQLSRGAGERSGFDYADE
jgi:hypothetical protein